MKQILALILLLLVAGGLVFYSQWRPARNTVSGFVEAHDIRIGSRVGGRIKEVLVQEGDRIAARPAGEEQPLVKLYPYDLQERRAEAQATLAARKAELERLTRGFRSEEIAEAKARRDQLAANLQKLQAGPRLQEKEIAKAQLAIAEAQLVRARAKFQRTEDIFKRGQATPEERDDATQQLRTAEAQVAVRRQELSLAEEGTREELIEEAKAQLAEAQSAWELRENGFRPEEIAAAKAAVEAADAALKVINTQIDELTIKAPPGVSGTIEALDLRPGDLVTANAPVLTIRDTSTLWVRAYIPGGQLSQADLHKVVPITIDAYPGERFKGEITYISPQAEFTPRNVQTIEERSKQVYRIKATLLDGLDKIRPGMIGDVWLSE